MGCQINFFVFGDLKISDMPVSRLAGFLQVVPVSREILVSAAQTRSQNLCLKLPDAIHFATAKDRGCQVFLTNDRRLKTYSCINTVILSEC